MNIVPLPRSVRHLQEGFAITPQTLITYSCASLQPVGAHLQRGAECQLGLLLSLEQDEEPGPSLHLALSPGLAEVSALTSGRDEAYTLHSSPKGVVVAAPTVQGVLYGVQSLLQLLPVCPHDPPVGLVPLPGLHIVDAPRFRWRGLMLDTGRHFFPVPFLLRVLDIMLLYKLNRFHWHLCEDQGWRLEVKQFPRLTEFGAWRAGDGGERYGGFYSQEEVRRVVEYAGERGIVVVPEIEMPGHCVAALASYPHLSCTGEVIEVSRHWGVHEDIYCAGREEVFAFLEGVLGEVLQLFPSTYIHVGGDEVPKSRWSQCPRCQDRIRAEGLEDEEELQSWFLDRINTFLRRHGRKLVGWDEILEGGLCEGATVMSWRGMAGGVFAARAGHDVVMTPTHNCYLDYRQAAEVGEPGAWYAVLPLRQVYEFDPIPPEPSAASPEPMQLDSGGEEKEEGQGGKGEASPAAREQQQQGGEAEIAPGEPGDGGGLREAVDEGLQPTVPPPPRPGASPAASEGGGEAEGADISEGAAEGDRRQQWQVEQLLQAGLTLTPEEAKHILGGQANLWTEYVAGEGVAEYMLVPRVCAMAEALWSPRSGRGWAGFRARLGAHEALWARLGIRHRALDDDDEEEEEEG